MSVVAMTMDDQRPLLNTYNNKMQEQQKYNEQQHINSTLASGPASPTPSGSEELMSQQYHPMAHYHHQSKNVHIYSKQHHYQQRADITKNLTDQKSLQQQQSSIMIEEQQQQQQQQQHNEQPASVSVTCAVTVKAESVGVNDANHGQPLLEGI